MELPELLKSKKFAASALASLIAFVGFHQGMTREQVAFVIGPLLVFVGSQAVADFGKEREMVRAAAPPKPSRHPPW